MMNAPGVAVAGHGGAYPAIILTPTEHGLRADGILTQGPADVLRHGLAWLGGDFRDGPSESGRAACRERGCPNGQVSVGAGSSKKTRHKRTSSSPCQLQVTRNTTRN